MRYRTYRLTLEYKTCWAIDAYNMYIVKTGIFPFFWNKRRCITSDTCRDSSKMPLT